METYSVYITTNLLNNKAYVGMTNGHNPRYMGSDPILRSDIKKFGKKKFSKTILGTFDNWEECHYWEGFYVKTLNTHVSKGGYNQSWTGGSYWKSFKRSSKTKKIMSVLKKGKPSWNKGKTIKYKPRPSRKGKPTWNKGLTGEAYTIHYEKGFSNQYKSNNNI